MLKILQQAPPGFAGGIDVVNKLDENVLKDLSYDVLSNLQEATGTASISVNKYAKLSEVNEESLYAAVRSLNYLFRSCSESSITPEALQKGLKWSFAWKDEAIQVILDVWQDRGAVLTVATCEAGANKLLDLQWSLGIAVTSNSCKNLNHPYVHVTMTIADTAGTLQTRTLEMTISEYRAFTKQLKEMSDSLASA